MVGFPPLRSFKDMSLQNFQTRGTDLEGLIRLAQGRGKEESILGAVPYFICYFQRCD
jgi:hypothetical protein